jgi:hypothetical protein
MTRSTSFNTLRKNLLAKRDALHARYELRVADAIAKHEARLAFLSKDFNREFDALTDGIAAIEPLCEPNSPSLPASVAEEQQVQGLSREDAIKKVIREGFDEVFSLREEQPVQDAEGLPVSNRTVPSFLHKRKPSEDETLLLKQE